MIRLVKATRFTQLQHKLLRRHSNFIQSMVCVFFICFRMIYVFQTFHLKILKIFHDGRFICYVRKVNFHTHTSVTKHNHSFHVSACGSAKHY